MANMSKTIEDLKLSPVMRRRAEELQSLFPQVVYTSGRRTLHDQALAMATNHIQDKSYIQRTYVHAADILTAIEKNALDHSVDSIYAAIYAVLEEDPSLVKSAHLSGDAVDLVPMETKDGLMTPIGLQVADWIKCCADTTDFRVREGNLRRWHWACTASKEV